MPQGLGTVRFDFTNANTGIPWYESLVQKPDGSYALELQELPEPATLSLLALGALVLAPAAGGGPSDSPYGESRLSMLPQASRLSLRLSATRTT